MYARELVGKVLCRRMNLRAYLEVWVIFPYLCTHKRNERPCGDAGSLTLEIFEIIDIDKQKCSNKRLGNKRPNRQLRTFT